MGETAVYDYQCLDDMAVLMRKEMTKNIDIYIYIYTSVWICENVAKEISSTF